MLPKRRWLRQGLVILLACSAASFLTYAAVAKPDPLSSLFMLYLANPVAVKIECRGSAKFDPEAQLAIFDGSARYTFTNTGDQRVQLVFPPAREFDFLDSQAGRPSASNFAADQGVVALAPGESKTFTEPFRRDFIVQQQWTDFKKGGPGFRAFVFAPPQGSDTDDFFIGTVFPIYRVVVEND